MAKQDRAVRTRRMILEAAALVFDERGYEAATITEVFERAGLTKGALYFHFPSKEDLARGVLAGATVLAGVRPQGLVLQELVDTLLLAAHRLPREPMLGAAFRIAVDPASRQLLGTGWPAWSDALTRLLRRAKERDEVHRHLDEAEAARIIVCAWAGVRVVTEGLPESYDLAREVGVLLGMLLPGIAVPSVLARLDVSPDRAARLYAELAEARARPEAGGGGGGRGGGDDPGEPGAVVRSGRTPLV
ncbi:ScbR family autoregulator-binding transcription factor [Streptomyces sp. SP18CS02]|uniref:ScbR family autoregulator-binding transcription factor n=1 Tax=Streptomyces sp. SP18CS02 TaxID=3002531 RepID=UPI002E794A6B|nr:ScbR family autoregulator-binding transcription factor [Streptomyces sp. SP18CS02]MEE1756578.1 ScbR family autoregulator-binding transcription factor [Streptomyces sp. SP18CS02]